MASDRDLKKIPSEGQNPNKLFSQRPVWETGKNIFIDALKVDRSCIIQNNPFNTNVDVNWIVAYSKCHTYLS